MPTTILSPIGLDLGSHSCKAMQLRKQDGVWAPVTSVSLPRATPGVPFTPQEIERFQGVLERRGFVGQDVVITVPASSLLTSILELPARGPGVPVEQIAGVEFARMHKQEAGSLTMSSWELPAPARAGKATYMLAVGATSADLNAHIDLVESGNLKVVAIDEPHTAAARGALHGAAPATELCAVINLGWDAGTLSIVNSNTVLYTRKLADAGLNRLYRMATEAVNDGELIEQGIWQTGFKSDAGPDTLEVLDVLQAHFAAVVREVNQASGYASHRYPDLPMQSAILIGGGAAIPEIASRFHTESGVPTSCAFAGGVGTALVTAMGLALWTGGGK